MSFFLCFVHVTGKEKEEKNKKREKKKKAMRRKRFWGRREGERLCPQIGDSVAEKKYSSAFTWFRTDE